MFIVFFCIVGCEKNQKSFQDKSLSNSTVHTGGCLPNNPLVSVDSVGEIHNEAMAYFENLEVNDDLSIAEQVMGLNRYFTDRWG